jgi:two-component system, NtrC family, response regulator AtoC
MTVLIRGESGTGKDVVARLISDLSGRTSSGGFVKINCPAIPDTLIESELFGHEVGAFTGASRRKPGRFELASRGTVFLDEVAEIPVTVQAKLLQVIEHKEFSRLGDTRIIKVNARILAATNAPIESMIQGGRFRSDLFFRLNEYCIALPPLRARPEDIPLLVDHFLHKHGVAAEKPHLRISAEMMAMFSHYRWPGNVRELESMIRRFALTGSEGTLHDAMAEGESMAALDLPGAPAVPASLPPSRDADATPFPVPPPHPSRSMLEENEIKTILRALKETQWNRRRAAERLGTSYSTLRRKIANYKLTELDR